MSVMLYLHEVPLSLWIGSCTFGLFMSSVFPSTLSFTENYIEVTGEFTVHEIATYLTSKLDGLVQR